METKKTLLQRLAVNKSRVLIGFRIGYSLILVLLGIFFYYNLIKINLIEMYMTGIWAGRSAIVIFSFVLLPGILKRFGLQWQIRSILMLFRRQLGVLTYGLIFLHYASILLFPVLTGRIKINPLLVPQFQLFGLSALYLLTPLFLTSNDWSTKYLGKWWGRLHKLVYVVAWLIFGHVAFQSNMLYSSIIGITATLELISLIYSYYLSKKRLS